MTKLYQERNKETNLKDRIYLSLVDNVIKGKSISRDWKKKLTGITPSEQRIIEKRNEDNVQVFSHHVPVSMKEMKGGKVGSKLVTPGQLNHSDVKFNRFDQLEEGGVNVFQVGNKTYLKPHLLISEFQRKKGFKFQKETDLNQLNDSLRDKDEVHWEDLSAVIDTSTERDDKSLRFIKLLNVKDNRKKTWKIFSRIDFSKVFVLTPKGHISPLRRYINCYS